MPSESTVEPGQIYQDKDKRRIERHVRVIGVTVTDALVRTCLANGTFCLKTPKTWVSLSRLQARFKLAAQLAAYPAEHDNS